MELDKAEKLARRLMKHHGLQEWTFVFDKAVVRFGCCNYRKKQISLSKELVLINNLKDVKDTILHEIAHALVGPKNGHNWVWRQKAIEIGCDGNRCYSLKSVKSVVGKPSAKCDVCGCVFFRHKKPSVELRCSIDCQIKSYTGSYLYDSQHNNYISQNQNNFKRPIVFE